MEPPEKDNVIDIMKRLKEKAEKERLVIKELMEADYDRFKEMVAYAINNLYEIIIDLSKDSLRMAQLLDNLSLKGSFLQDRFNFHSHEVGLVEIPEWVRDLHKKDGRETSPGSSSQDD